MFRKITRRSLRIRSAAESLELRQLLSGVGEAAEATTTISGSVSTYHNLPYALNAPVFVDLNNDGEFQSATEPFSFLERYSYGYGRSYQIHNVPVGRTVTVRSLHYQADNLWAPSQPSLWRGVTVTTTAAPVRNVNFSYSRDGGRLSGYAFADANANGMHDADEGEITPAQIWLDVDNDRRLDADEPRLNYNRQLVPGPSEASGYFSIYVPAGTWTVAARLIGDTDAFADVTQQITVTNTPEYVYFKLAVTGVAPTPTVAGQIFADPDGDGANPYGREVELAGRVVFADYNYNSQPDADEPLAYTDWQGNFALPTRAENVTVRLVLNPGETNSFGGLTAGYWFPTLTGTQRVTFGVKTTLPPIYGSITGTLWEDRDGDWSRDTDEPLLTPEPGGTPYSLYLDVDRNGKFDPAIDISTTSTDGTYRFDNVINGPVYQVRLLYTPAQIPASGLYWYGGMDQPRHREAQALIGGSSLHFGFRQATTVYFDSIFDDSNGNSIRDPGEAEYDFYLDINDNRRRDAEDLDPITLNTPTGSRRFLNLPGGVLAIIRPGLDVLQRTLAVSSITSVRETTLTLPLTPSYSRTISGIVFNDANANNIHDADETAAIGRLVFGDVNRNGQLDANEPRTQTDGSGRYFISIPFNYDVRAQVLPIAGTTARTTSGRDYWERNGYESDAVAANFAVRGTPVSTLTGKVYADTNRNGRLDEAETPLAGRTVYADYNYNARLDIDEPFAQTDVAGYYTLRTRREQIDLRVLTLRGEEVTLGYGANAIWIPVVDGILTDKNFPIGLPAQTTTVSGYVYLDFNSNGLRDVGDPVPWNLETQVFADLNNDGEYGSGEPITTPGGPSGAYMLTGLPVGRPIAIRIVLGQSNLPYIVAEPTPWHHPTWLVSTTSAARTDVNFGLDGWSSSGFLHSGAFLDADYDDVYDSDEMLIAAEDLWIDINGNRLHDADEPELQASTDDSGVAVGSERILTVPIGQWQVAVRFAGDTDLLADEVRVATIARFEGGSVYFPRPAPGPTITGTVYDDANRNGRRDADEAGLSARTVYADYNYNGLLDPGELWALTDLDGNYTLGTRPFNVDLRVLLLAGEELTLGYGASSLWIPVVAGAVTGKNLGIAR